MPRQRARRKCKWLDVRPAPRAANASPRGCARPLVRRSDGMAGSRPPRAHRRDPRPLPDPGSAYLGTGSRPPLYAGARRTVPVARPHRFQRNPAGWPPRAHRMPRRLRDRLPSNVAGTDATYRRLRRSHVGHRRPTARRDRTRVDHCTGRSRDPAGVERVRGVLCIRNYEGYSGRAHPYLARSVVAARSGLGAS